ncbi:CHASE2 domain-containing protein, partial [Sulfurovum sp.]|uniref:CHASE2 domain-containing protein n=1 Tax=Sulfurovum sp. TaxID=1969726 RepID=UPI0025E54D19
MKSTPLKVATAALLSLFFSWLYLYTPQAYYSLDNKLYDFMFLIRGELPKSDKVVIVDVDNRSLEKIGQWPWPRNKIAAMLQKLSESHAGIIGLDMVFSEPDRTSPHLLQKRFPSITQTLPNNDRILANVFSHAPVVGGYIFTPQATSEKDTPLIPAIFIQKGLKDTSYLLAPKGVVLNIPILQNALYSSGFFNTDNIQAGVIRSTPLIERYRDDIYPSLALEMLRIYSAANKVEVVGDENGVAFIQFGKYHIPTGSSGEFLINFRGPQKHFKYISAVDILEGHFDPASIKNRFVLVGTSAPGLKDLRAIPFDSVYPGVEVHANIIDNILQGDLISKPFISRLYDLVIIWILVFGLMYLFSVLRSSLLLPVAILLFFFMLFLFYEILFVYGLALTLVTPVFAFISTLIASLTIDYFITSKHKEQAKRILSKKVSTSVMNHLLAHSGEDLIAPKEVEATIFFSDIREFTNISEKIGSPTRLIELLNAYMTPMVDTIITQQGTIDKFIGDAIMAYWNAPVPVDDHADAAVQTAIRQIELLEEINTMLQGKYRITLQIGIGIHTGVVTAGDMGSQGRSDYTVIGDNVNIASRLEGLTKVYHAQILIS